MATGSDIRTLVSRLIAREPRGRWRLVVSILLAIFASGCAVALMGVSGWMLSRAAEHPPVLYLLAASVGVRFFGIGRGVGRYLERLTGHDLALRMQSGLRELTFTSLSRTTLLGRRYGDLLVRVTADVEGIVDLVVRVIMPFSSAVVVFLGTSAILTIFNPLDAVVLLAISIVAGVVVPWLASRWSRQADEQAVPARGELGDKVREISLGAADMVAYGLVDRELAALAAIDGELRTSEREGAWTRGVAEAAQMLSTGLAVVAGLAIGGAAVANGTMLGRDLAILVLVPLALHEVYSDFTKSAQTLTRSRAALTRVLDVLRAEPVGSGDRVADPESTVTGLHLHDVGVGWPDGPELLAGIDLDVQPGHSVALTGPSGLGKTTLAATVMGLIPARGGRLLAPGRVGYLEQSSHIFATSLAENVRIGNKDATDAQVVSAMSKAGLQLDPQREVGEQGATLSGGEAQRVALARLLASSEPYGLVILDEPTEHLDRETAQALLDDLFTTLADTALLVITHDEDLMARCDRVVDLSRWACGGTLR